jgi:hypothetical protein
MPQFKSTKNIFGDFGDEVWDRNWVDSDTVVLPPNPDWSYDRILQLEDIDIWEVIIERGGSVALYAAWMPYAEYYLVRYGPDHMEAFYGRSVRPMVKKFFDDRKIMCPPPELMRYLDKVNMAHLGRAGNVTGRQLFT